MKKIALLSTMFLVTLFCADLSAQACCVPNPACKVICGTNKAEAQSAATVAQPQTAPVAAASCTSQTATAGTAKFVNQPVSAAKTSAKTMNCDPAACDPSNCDLSKCDPSQCDPSKCDLSKCLPGSNGIRKTKV